MKPARHFAKAILLLCLPLAVAVLGSASQSLAQDDAGLRGALGPIDRTDLIEALAQQARGGPKVAGHVVYGPDVIDILRRGDVPIELRDCVIEDGLDFLGIAAVARTITIENCEIRAAPLTRAPSAGTSVYAQSTKFERQVTIRSSTLVGPADFTDAEFQKKAMFAGSQFPGGASFASARFSEAAHFSRSHFKSVQFDTASFNGEATFRRAEFDTEAYFDRANFAGRADFREAVFRAEQSFFATFQGPVSFGKAWFYDEVTFDGPQQGGASLGAHFMDEVGFDNTRFKKAAFFGNQVFPADTNFAGAEFDGKAQFGRVHFRKQASFGGAQFGGRAEFQWAAFEEDAGFQYAVFLGEADFSEVRFANEVSFVSTKFCGRASFILFQANRFASFRSAKFDKEADFNGAAFGESADFQGTGFKDLLRLTGADFGAYADFRDAGIARLDLNSVHNPTILKSRIDMRGARIGEAHLQDVIFTADVDFSDADFGLPAPNDDGEKSGDPASGTTIFRFTTFEDDVSFTRARFAGRLSLQNVKFQRTADFTDADFGGILRDDTPSFAFSYVDFGDLRLRWPQLPEPRYWAQSQEDATLTTLLVGSPEPISRTLAELEESFRAADRLEDANAAYFQRKLAELREARSGGWDSARLLSEVEWLFWGLVCGYGTKLWWALGWAVLVDAIFTLIYWSSATVTRHPHPDAKEEFSFRLRLLDLPKQYAADRADLPVKPGPLRKLIDSLRVSSAILFKLGYRDTTLGGRFGPLPIAYLVAVEWALGFYLLAALTVTLANTQPLINRLLSGVF